MKQVYHHYSLWEDYKNGMYNKAIDDKAKMLDKAIDFTGNCNLYGHWMLEVIKIWNISCEHNLTNLSINRKAWIGHAACCMAIGCPEHITREAWGFLSEKQQKDANDKADYAIMKWEENYHGTKNECFMF